MTSPAPLNSTHEPTTVATLQSLIVAFVLAMTFRGFVTEGFVIPTGSMAPTLMGEHVLLHSEKTGSLYPVDSKYKSRASKVYDPMLGKYPMDASGLKSMRTRMGDRILVLKCLYPFAEPDRFDVVVFKNPTDPDGDAENYIKRLIGLPNEALWLVDGDVFVAPAKAWDDLAAYEIQRKPQYIQRAVWQPIHDSDYVPSHPQRLRGYAPPWSGEGWQTTGRSYRCDSAGTTTLSWSSDQLALSDWTHYNMFTEMRSFRARNAQNVSDLRVCADVVADAADLEMTFDLEARGHRFRFSIGGGEATLHIQPLEPAAGRTLSQSIEAPMPEAGRVYSVEFWQVDQAMSIFVNGRRVGAPLEYDWAPRQRIEHAFGIPFERWTRETPEVPPRAAQLRWTFSGSPVTLHRVRVDRDLYYRPDELTKQAEAQPTRPQYARLVESGSPAFGTHPDKPAILGPDHYFMLGDNSPASSDSRLWGNPHPYVAQQIDDHPFVVHRRLLLGKAWVVYFPALYPVTPNGRGVVPDFGRLRFIR